MKNTSIEWADHTFNPWIGCTKVSPGCANCYAEAMDSRFHGNKHWGKGAPRRRTSEANWKQPLRWNDEAGVEGWQRSFSVGHRPRVFCASMADWLDDEIPAEWRVDLFQLVAATENLDWLLLTKRPENFRRLAHEALAWLNAHLFVSQGQQWIIQDNPNFLHCSGVLEKSPEDCWEYVDARKEALGMLAAWLISDADDMEDVPPCNVWIGVTAEDQARADERIPALLEIPAKVRFLSCEPLLGPVDFQLVPGFNKAGSAGVEITRNLWVICGGESGPKARPMHPDWARSLRDQCAAAGVPFFFKQWGDWIPVRQPSPKELTAGASRELIVPHRGEVTTGLLSYDPDTSWVMHKVGKKAAGRLLDGVEHNNLPAAKGGV